MKPIHYILICCLLGLVSCGDSSLSKFSKIKYLKKAPKQLAVEQLVHSETKVYASTEMSLEPYLLEEVPEIYKVVELPELNQKIDTIITKDGEEILCYITLINENNIFYEIYPKKNRKVILHISKTKVSYYTGATNEDLELLEVKKEEDVIGITNIMMVPDSNEYNDTIITHNGTILVCKITTQNRIKLFYHHDPEDGKIIRRSLNLTAVKYKSIKNVKKESKAASIMFGLTLLGLIVIPIFAIIVINMYSID